jgi:hypothetical protein
LTYLLRLREHGEEEEVEGDLSEAPLVDALIDVEVAASALAFHMCLFIKKLRT